MRYISKDGDITRTYMVYRAETGWIVQRTVFDKNTLMFDWHLSLTMHWRPLGEWGIFPTKQEAVGALIEWMHHNKVERRK